MDQIKIGAFLKVLRKEKTLTQEQLAEQLGVSGRTVSRYEPDNPTYIRNTVDSREMYDMAFGLL